MSYIITDKAKAFVHKTHQRRRTENIWHRLINESLYCLCNIEIQEINIPSCRWHAYSIVIMRKLVSDL
jgi:hypothetical protein